VLRSRTRIFHPSVSQICPKLRLGRLGAHSADQTVPSGAGDESQSGGYLTGWIIPEISEGSTEQQVRRLRQKLVLRDSGSGPECPSCYEHLNIDAGMPAIAKDRSPANPSIRRIATLSCYRSSDHLKRWPLSRNVSSLLTAHRLCRYVSPISDRDSPQRAVLLSPP
jgi:hypothetical protein